MLYNSFQFVFIFLPIALLGYWVAGFFRTNLAQLSWLVLVSSVFYASWEPIYLVLLLGSIAFNFMIGRTLEHCPHKAILAAGIVLKLLILGYFKYRIVL